MSTFNTTQYDLIAMHNPIFDSDFARFTFMLVFLIINNSKCKVMELSHQPL